ncbi:murein biosynthesis integral membrane protein MurJ [bacterium]|nr:murein biosynthesis integral membrane protein MurJ [bacterium]
MTSTDPTKQKKIFRAIGIVGLITTISRILGLIREIVIANCLGTSAFSDAFTIAFMIPNLFRRLFSEGALVNIFIPVFKEIETADGKDSAFEFALSCFWFFFFFSLVFCSLFIVFAPEILRFGLAVGLAEDTLNISVFLTRIMIGYVLFISLASICQGILNAFSVFWVSSLTPVLLNLTIISFAVILTPLFQNPAVVLSIGVITGGSFQLLFQIPFTIKQGLKLVGRITFNSPYLRRTLILMLPSVFGIGIYQINILISTSVASLLYEGSISSLKFSNRLVELIIGVLIISLTTVILPRLADLFLEQNKSVLEKSLAESLRVITFITFPIIMGTIALNEEIVSLVFGRGKFDQYSVSLTCSALKFHIMGLTFIAWNRILLTFYQASKKVKATVQAGILVILINLLLAFGLSRIMGHSGIALGTSISQFLHTVLLLLFLKKLPIRIPIFSFFRSTTLWLSLLTSTLMYILLIYLKDFQWFSMLPKPATLFILITLGGIFYLMISYLIRSKELLLLMKEFKHIKSRK